MAHRCRLNKYPGNFILETVTTFCIDYPMGVLPKEWVPQKANTSCIQSWTTCMVYWILPNQYPIYKLAYITFPSKHQSFTGIWPQIGYFTGIAGLAVTYGINLNVLQASVIWNICNAENKMISVERVLQYSNLPSEAPLVVENCRLPNNWPEIGTICFTNLKVRLYRKM